MTVEEGLVIVETILGDTGLNDLQELIFRQSWEQKTYPEIAEAAGYDAEYIKLVAFQFWKTLSQALNEKVTKNNFRSVLRRKSNLINNITTLTTPSIDWGEAIDVSVFYGRAQELMLLEQWITQENCRLVALLGIGGIGKTSLCVKLGEKIQNKFEYVIWRSLHNAPKIESLLINLIEFLSQSQESNLTELFEDKISQLIYFFQKHRCLLILDNIETVLNHEDYKQYGELLQRIGESRHQSCLLLTSREKPKEIALLAGETFPVRCLQLSGLSIKDAQSIFCSKGNFTGSIYEWQSLIQSYGGNPLALKIVATTIRDLFDSNIYKFLEEGVIVFGDIEELIEQQFKSSSAIEKEILYWLAINREAITFSELQADLLLPTYRSELLEALQGLERRSLIEISTSAFTLQPVLMEYMTNHLIKQVCQELEKQQIYLFKTHALFKTTAKDYIKQIQISLIINPIIKQLLYIFGTKKRIEGQLMTIIDSLRNSKPIDTGYVCGNTINIFRHLEIHLNGKDFSGLTIWQADFQGADLYQTNFTNSDLARSFFTTNLSYPFTVAVSPDGNIVATGDSHGKISLWQATDGQQLITWEGHTGWVRWIVFTGDSKTLISGSDDGSVKQWEITGKWVKTFVGHNGFVICLALVEANNYSILASSSMDQSLKVWNFQTGECLLTIQGHTGWFPWISLSPDGQTLVSGSADHLVKLWNTNTGECLNTLLGHNNNVWSVVFCMNGNYVVSSDGDGIVKIWDVKTGECLHTLVGHTAQVWCVTCNYDGILASCSGDKTIRLWDIQTGECIKIIRGHTNGIRSIAFTPQNSLIATDEDKTVKFWDIKTGQCYKTFQGYADGVWAVAFSASKHILASGNEDQSIKLWDINTGTCIKTLRGHTNFIPALAFSPDGKTLASGSSDETVRIWDIETGECLRIFKEYHNWIMSVTYSPDGKILASSDSDRKVRFWDVATARPLGVLDNRIAMILSLVYNHEGNLLIGSGGEDMVIRAWDRVTLKCVKIFAGHNHGIWSVVLNPVNHNILASGSEDKTVKIWDFQTCECLKTLTGHTQAVVSVAYSPDGALLASGSKDQTVKIWDVETGECLKTFKGHTRWIYQVVFIDSSCVVSSSQDQTIRLWDIKTGDCLKIFKSHRPYEQMNITGTTGLTQTTKATLLALGAIESV